MKVFRSALMLLVVATIMVMQARPSLAQSADAIWAHAVQRIKSTKSYTLSYEYRGPKGEYAFEYAVVRPDAIKTKIVKGANTGATLIYNPNEYGNEVRARKGMLGKGIALNDPQVANTPIIQPVYDMLLEKTRGQKASLTGNDKVYGHDVWVLNVGGQTVAVDKNSYDVLHWAYTDGEGPHDRVFYNIQINSNPRISF